MKMGVAIALIGFTVINPAAASTVDGQIQDDLRDQHGLAGGIRVSVRTNSRSTPCGNTVWFSYEHSAASPAAGKEWTATLIAAKLAGQILRVEGTGTCDQHNVERVNAISIL